jgi:hypothetical protein
MKFPPSPACPRAGHAGTSGSRAQAARGRGKPRPPQSLRSLVGKPHAIKERPANCDSNPKRPIQKSSMKKSREGKKGIKHHVGLEINRVSRQQGGPDTSCGPQIDPIDADALANIQNSQVPRGLDGIANDADGEIAGAD